ncbi:MAG: hypothetical protein ACFFFK_12710 [Candidatus Thorarchaeota archaeon]
MSHEFIQNNANVVNVPREIVFLILIVILLPHTFEINVVNAMDASYLRYSIFAAFWTVSLTTGSNIAGPFTSTSLEFLTVQVIVFCVLFLPLYLILIYARLRAMKGSMSKRSMFRYTGVILVVQMFILFAFFWYSLDGWAFAQSYPLPFIHLLIIPKWMFH